MKVLVEGIGSMVFGTQLKYYNQMNWQLVGIDITNKSFGLYKGLKPYIVPKYSEKNCKNCFEKIEEIVKNEKIDLVFCTVNEGLLEWSKRKKYFKERYNTNVVISDEEVIEICIDKWKTYNFFCENDIPTPRTSLKNEFELLKPRIGRGGCGIYHKNNLPENFNMKGYISQELVEGEEYTIDVLCDLKSNPIYIIPRKRIETESGVSTKGVTIYDEKIIEYVKLIISRLKPVGIINIQCFKNGDDINFIEINPRIAGGISLSFASSDNWFKAIECFYYNKEYVPKKVIYNNYMFRFYEDLIIHESNLL
ncbi:ATP-grasp domain-containing protein [Calorimonas adulescens]|uniref:ATP-grasp domain-containing protein n=1 Tax=Calorimonas adulescens TaxID=2606906 RepID=A0A5D8QCC1_9THEO|nr:ATP-grasp domain-containing protein [Calorimonas adulescens]TZE82182.1 ATP-grasp domain-containing protein [Calorimonas adulescens]